MYDKMPAYLSISLSEITQLYQFDGTYTSKINAIQLFSQRENNRWSSKIMTRALEFAKGTFADELFGTRDALLSHYDEMKRKQEATDRKVQEELREKYETLAREHGVEYVHSILREKDPESAEKLHPNDVKRVIRALEIYDVTGKPKSMQQDLPVPRFNFAAVSIDYPREQLYDRINLRVDEMFRCGLIGEVEALLSAGVTTDMQCMQGIGYKEVVEGLQLGQSEEEIKEIIKKNTRNYAKRQITFFKRMQNHTLLTPAEDMMAKVEQLMLS
jgi:tRNA dimethylallyltransferase